MSSVRLLAWVLVLSVLAHARPLWGQDDDPAANPQDEMKAPPAEPKGEAPKGRKKNDRDSKLGQRLRQMRPMGIDEMLAKHDVDQSGDLSKEELAAMKRGRLEQIQGQFADRILKRFDADGDGVLSPTEQAEADARTGEVRKKIEQVMDRMLSRVDEDQDGSLSPSELAKAREMQAARDAGGAGAGRKTIATPEGGSAGTPPTEPKKGAAKLRKGGSLRELNPAELIASADANQDGALDQSEIAAFRTARKQQMLDGQRRGLMGRFDDNKDGELTGDEATARDEYLKYLEIESGIRVDMFLERFDRNHDGQIDAQELEKLRAGMSARRTDEGEPRKGREKKQRKQSDDATAPQEPKPAGEPE